MTDDFYSLFNKNPPPVEGATAPRLTIKPANGVSSYAAAALRGEAQEVATAAEGTRNHTLNKAWFNMGRHVGAGTIELEIVRLTLAEAARQAGLPQAEIDVVLRDDSTSAVNAGAAIPRHPTPLPELPVPVVVVGQVDTDDPGPPLNPIIDWHDLFATEDDGEEWIVEPLLPARRMVALYSAPKAGKSLLMLEIAVAMARGGKVIGTDIDRPYRVLYIDFENDPRGDVRARLEAMEVGPDQLDNLCYLTYPSMAKFDTVAGAVDLMRHVEAYRCEVVVIDTVSRAVMGEENENDTWLSFYRNTGLSLKRAGVACIRLDHSGKDQEKGMRGGSAKYGDVDAVWRLRVIGEDTVLLECTDNRMPVPVRNITLTRQEFPLSHQPADGGWQAVADAKTRRVDQRLNELGVPSSASVRESAKALREAGEKVENRAIREAVGMRKLRLDLPSTGVPGTPPAHPGTPGVSVPGADPYVVGPPAHPSGRAETARHTTSKES